MMAATHHGPRRLRPAGAGAARSAVAVVLLAAAGAVALADAAAPAPPKSAASAADSVVMCANCATVLSVRSETRVAGRGIGQTAGESLDSGVLGDQPNGRDINDTTDVPAGATTNGLIVPKADRRMADSTVWKVVVQRRDGSTTTLDVADDPVLRPGDVVTIVDGKLGRKR